MNKKNKHIVVLAALVAVGLILFISNRTFNAERMPPPSERVAFSFPTLSLPSLQIPTSDKESLAKEAWSIFQTYLQYAQTHNLIGIKSLSHQISETCLDPAQEAECFTLMDNVYAFGHLLEESEFRHIESDSRQIVMYTDGPVVAFLYFSRDANGTPKVLGMRFCIEDEKTPEEKCVEAGSIREDVDRDGWWDSVESLFYE